VTSNIARLLTLKQGIGERELRMIFQVWAGNPLRLDHRKMSKISRTKWQ